MTEVLPEASHPADNQPHPALIPTPPHTIPPAAPPPLAAGTQHPGTHTSTPSVAHRGREKLHWDHKVWERLDHAVHREVERTRVAAKFLPTHRVPEKTTTVESDIVVVPPLTVIDGVPLAAGAGAGLSLRWKPDASPPVTASPFQVDEGATTRLVEIWVEFSLTPQQVEHEGTVSHDQHGAAHHAHTEPTHHDAHQHNGQHASHHHHHGQSTATTMVTRAANILAQAEDALLFGGLGAFSTDLFRNFVRWRTAGQPADWGLLDVIPSVPPAVAPPFGPLPAAQVITVPLKPPPPAGDPPSLYGEHTFDAVTAGYAQLMGAGHYGRYALTLHNVPFADTFAPLKDTLIMPADRIAPLMTAGFRDSGTLDAPGKVAADAGAAAAATAAAGGGPTAAAQAAALKALLYGAALDVAAKTASQAFAAPNPPDAASDTAGGKAALSAAALIPSYPGPVPASVTPAASGLPSYYGSLVSLGGNTMDRVVGIEPTVGFMQQDVDGSFRFRVFERLALRIKDISAVIRLEFV